MVNTIDPVRAAGLVTREIRSGTREGKPTKIAVARRWYAAERPDVWDPLTNGERIPRWFLPISGDLAIGGRYQLEGNASGVVESCQAPERFALTWEFAGQVSWVRVSLREADGGTTLELFHEAHVDPELWAQFGPGAVGLGWDLGLFQLGEHLAGAAIDPAEGALWPTTPEGVQFMRQAGQGWARAATDAGDDPEQGPGGRGNHRRHVHDTAGADRGGLMDGAVFDALGDPVRRRILELLGNGERPAGAIAHALHARFGISQPASSQHLRVLHRGGLVSVRVEGTRRVYGVDTVGLAAVQEWLAQFADAFAQPLDALETELARGRRERRLAGRDRARQPGSATRRRTPGAAA